MSRYILLFFFFFLGSQLFAQNTNTSSIAITTVAIIDVQRVYDSFPDESRGYNSLSQLKQKYQREIDEQVRRLDLLKQQRARSLEDGAYDRATNYEEQIANLTNLIEALSERRQNELIQLSKLPLSRPFLEKLQNAIEFVAQENGFTIVLHSNTEGLQWWSPVVDISEKVIDRIKRQ